jgi:hypothetical protein
VCWADANQLEAIEFAQDLSQPAVSFSRGGWLVAADRGECQVYHVGDHRVQQVAAVAGNGDQPLAVLATPHMHQFALLLSSGLVRCYRIPR